MTAGKSIALVLALFMAGTAASARCIVPEGSGAMQKELLVHLNAERKARGLPALKLVGTLDKAAQAHACDNAKRRSTSHVSSDGSRLQHRLKRVGYDFMTAAENTGRGFASGKRAVEWWMNSPGHKANMLRSDTTEVGIGIALSDAPESRLHWIMVVGSSY